MNLTWSAAQNTTTNLDHNQCLLNKAGLFQAHDIVIEVFHSFCEVHPSNFEGDPRTGMSIYDLSLVLSWPFMHDTIAELLDNSPKFILSG